MDNEYQVSVELFKVELTRLLDAYKAVILATRGLSDAYRFALLDEAFDNLVNITCMLQLSAFIFKKAAQNRTKKMVVSNFATALELTGGKRVIPAVVNKRYQSYAKSIEKLLRELCK